eukprot:Skav230321  [mRNA]  locus=scaffold430:415991:422052:+ [translate_table: standard]
MLNYRRLFATSSMTNERLDIYPAVRRFLLESGLNRTLKALDKEPNGSPSRSRTARALKPPPWRRNDHHFGANHSGNYPTLETSALEDVPVVKPKKAKALEPLELVQACQTWLDAAGTVATETVAVEETVEEVARPNKKRKREDKPQVEPPAPETVEANEVNEATEAVNEAAEEEKKEKKEGTPFKRIDDDKWKATIKEPSLLSLASLPSTGDPLGAPRTSAQDSRLLDNTHLAKQKFGGSKGDSWADQASEDLLKVKGKGQ